MSTVAIMTFVLCTCALLPHASADMRGRCPAQDVSCPARATPCSSDSECGEQVCCNSTCGKVCTDPLFTGCENVKLSSERISRALAAENTRNGRGITRKVRSPRCRLTDGEFEEIQCDNEIVSSCWCVDAAGFEIAGTRAPAASLVNCTQQAPCAAHTCRMLCPLGFELDSRGCPLCKCLDPCSGITCPGQLACQLEEAPCLKQPCPPVPTCKRGRSLQNICPVSEPLLIPETSRPFLCGTDPGKPNCPPLYKCLVDSGNDYGVCCPASLELHKAGTCPDSSTENEECGAPCAHDLECPSMQKCCDGSDCGKHCVLPHNVTICTQQKMLAELLVITEKEGKGYVPQCKADGSFETRQCSRNGLVCWCVDTDGNKLRGSMGPSSQVSCPKVLPSTARGAGRSLVSSCGRSLCAAVCEYGYKTGEDGCPSCECDDPCAAYKCKADEECVTVKSSDCEGNMCTGYPVCRPRISYVNPCSFGTPSTDETGAPLKCSNTEECPVQHECSKSARMCCPLADDSGDSESEDSVQMNFEACSVEADALCGMNSTMSCEDGYCDDGQFCCSTAECGPVCVDKEKMKLQSDAVDEAPSMCEYLRDFDDKMEGTVDGMKLAIPPPQCAADGSYEPQQCTEDGECWCVDNFGTKIPGTRTNNASAIDCEKVRSELQCLDMTCRLGCDYGFKLNADGCPTCECRSPCERVNCGSGLACAPVDVACDAAQCPPVPACLPRKAGTCPLLVPEFASCEVSCRSDSECGPGELCCATGCGAACTTPLKPCQQRRALVLHNSAESGIPPSHSWVPECIEDGSYHPIQCRLADNQCWCVDELGNEISGTRATNSTPNCSSPSKCQEPDCGGIVQCPFGRKFNSEGCPTCDCVDACEGLICREGEKCEVVPQDCGGSCPPLAQCSPAAECPFGAALMTEDGTRVICGPGAAACPSSHACRIAPSVNPPVCCPKPRTVCYDNKDEGICTSDTRQGLNVTRWYFNKEKNRCEKFKYQGCSGNHNNFKSKEDCNSVCPVLSPCERLREKNEAAAEKIGKGAFIPKCDSTGAWESVQCMSNIDVCWCVSARGEPLKGSLVRGSQPACNFRQARKWVRRDPYDDKARADEVLEELIRQMTSYKEEDFSEEDEEDLDRIELLSESRENDNSKETEEILKITKETNEVKPDLESSTTSSEKPITEAENLVRDEVIEQKHVSTFRRIVEKPLEVSTDKITFKTKCQLMQEEAEIGTGSFRPHCLSDGSFASRQCSGTRCWCVDAAGQPRHNVPSLCEQTQIESASLELELINVDPSVGDNARIALSRRLAALGSRVPVVMSRERGGVKLRASLNGPRSVDVVYNIENMVKQDKLTGAKKNQESFSFGADFIRSEYRLAAPQQDMHQREILSESTVSAATSYHTALIVLAATSAFIISVLCVLVMLYRARLQREPHKAERFLPPAPPVYVLSPDEKAALAKALHGPPLPVLPHGSHEENTRI